MCMYTRRLQILLDDERHERLTRIARERGMSVGAMVREAIDRGLASPAERGSALRHVLDAPDMDVGSVAELRDELDEVRARRA